MKVWRAPHPPLRGNYWTCSQPMVHRGFLASYEASGLNLQARSPAHEGLGAGGWERRAEGWAASAPPCRPDRAELYDLCRAARPSETRPGRLLPTVAPASTHLSAVAAPASLAGKPRPQVMDTLSSIFAAHPQPWRLLFTGRRGARSLPVPARLPPMRPLLPYVARQSKTSCL